MDAFIAYERHSDGRVTLEEKDFLALVRGFKPVPTMYDIVADQVRPVTQADVDRMVEVQQLFGKVFTMMKEFVASNGRVK